jgi:hypothetical protein
VFSKKKSHVQAPVMKTLEFSKSLTCARTRQRQERKQTTPSVDSISLQHTTYDLRFATYNPDRSLLTYCKPLTLPV